MQDNVELSQFQTMLDLHPPLSKGVARPLPKNTKTGFIYSVQRNMLTMTYSVVRPDISVLENGRPREEMRAQIDLQPISINLDQDTLEFLIEFFVNKKSIPLVQNTNNTIPYFQIFELSSFSITIDYGPKHFDIGRLYSGDYGQLLHVFPFNDVTVDFKSTRLTGIKVQFFSYFFNSIIGVGWYCIATFIYLG